MITPDCAMEFHEIARELGISVRRVQQLYANGMKKLKSNPQSLQAIQYLTHELEKTRPYQPV